MADIAKIYYQPQPLLPVNNHTDGDSRKVARGDLPAAGGSFADLLDEEIGQVKFSQHAAQRLKMRNLRFTPDDMKKLNQAVEKAASKGARESLVLMNDVALVVSVKNKTVITAMDGGSARENVFTNIDSAVIV